MTASIWWLLRRRLVSWWRRPPAADRVLCELVVRAEPMAGLDIQLGANVFGSVYSVLHRLEDEGLVASEVDPELTVYTLGDRPLHRRRYWLTEAGRRRALAVPRW